MKRTKNTLKNYFQTGDIPEQWQYENLIDSFWHLDDTLPTSDLHDQLARRNEDNQFSTIQTFNNDINIIDPQPYVSITGTDATNRSAKIGLNTPGGLWTLENSNDFRIDFNGESSFLSLGRLASGKVQLGTNNLERYEIDASGNHDFKSGTVTFGGAMQANNGLEINFPLTPLDVANQPVGAILIENNASGAEAPSIAGKTDANSPGLQFIASTRDASGTLADMIFNIRENNNTDFTAELDTVGFQFRRFSTPLVNIYRNGKQENLFGLDVHGQATFNDEITCESSATASIFFVDSPSGWLVKNTLGNHGVYFDGTETILTSNGVYSVRADGTTVNLRDTVVDGSLHVQNGADLASDGTDGSEVLRFSLDGDRDWAFLQKGSGAGTSLELRSTQNKDYYHYATTSFFGNSVDDSNHFTLNHSSKTASLTGTLDVSGLLSANSGLTINQPDQNTRLLFTRSGHSDYGVSLLDGKGLTVTNLNSNVKEMQFTSTGKVDFNAEIVANNGIKLKDNSWLWSQYSAAHDELRLNSNSANGWDFYNQTNANYANIRAAGAEFHGIISAYSSARIPDNQYLYLGDNNDVRLFHNGSHSYIDNFTGDLIFRNLRPSGDMKFAVDDSASIEKTLIYLNGFNQYVSLMNDGSEKLRTTSTGIEIDDTITTPTDTHLNLVPNGNSNVVVGSTTDGAALQIRSRLNDGQYTSLTHSGTHTQINTTHDAGFHFNQGIEAEGDIRPISGTYKSSDGTAGFTGTFSTSTHNITVKDGIITDAAAI